MSWRGCAAPGTGADRDAAVAALKPLHAATDRAVARPATGGRAAGRTPTPPGGWPTPRRWRRTTRSSTSGPRWRRRCSCSDTVLGNYHRAVEALLNLLAEPSPGGERQELTEAVLRYVQLARVKELSSRIRAAALRRRPRRPVRAGRPGDAHRPAGPAAHRARRVPGRRDRRPDRAATTGPRSTRRSSRPPGWRSRACRRRHRDAGGARPRTQWWAASEQRQELLRQMESGVLDDAVRRADEASAAQLRAHAAGGRWHRRGAAGGGGDLAAGRPVDRPLACGSCATRRCGSPRWSCRDALERLRTVDVRRCRDRRAARGGPVAWTRSARSPRRSSRCTAARSASRVEQATMRRNVNAMFVNLARRSQVLVERQLELLDELEREESDPDQLENLFKLDHLAARMRRNDESLLVLAGSESTRRWTDRCGLRAVLLAASGGDRAVPAGPPRVRTTTCTCVGHAVGDLVHLFAELLENATSFSRPDTTVRVTAPAGGRRRAWCEIADDRAGHEPGGAGARPTRCWPSRRPPTSPASERMGLFVVSHLAARHGITGAAAGRRGGPGRPGADPGGCRPTLPAPERRPVPSWSRPSGAGPGACTAHRSGRGVRAPRRRGRAAGGADGVRRPVSRRRRRRSPLPARPLGGQAGRRRPDRRAPCRAGAAVPRPRPAPGRGTPAPAERRPAGGWWSPAGGRRRSPVRRASPAPAARRR